MDTIAIVPFDAILNSGDNVNKLSRFFRLGRLYKMVKMTRLIRMLKIVKDRNKLAKYFEAFEKAMPAGIGIERLFFMVLLFALLCHIVACIW